MKNSNSKVEDSAFNVIMSYVGATLFVVMALAIVFMVNTEGIREHF